MTFMRSALGGTAMCFVPMFGWATSFTLDFGNVSAPNFGTTGLIEFTDVADGINATLTTTNTFASRSATYNGSVNGDIRVNAVHGQTVKMTLTLFDAAMGNGFSTVYDPEDDFDWALGFFDIDGWDRQPATYYDTVTIHAPTSGEVSYSVTETTVLEITEDLANRTVAFSAENAEGILGPSGLSGEMSQELSDVSMILSLSNLATISFDYTAVGFAKISRNLLIDGGSVTLAGPAMTTEIRAVPLPATGALMISALAAVSLARRSRKG